MRLAALVWAVNAVHMTKHEGLVMDVSEKSNYMKEIWFNIGGVPATQLLLKAMQT